MAQDYYGVLGVARNASEAEIKAAFRKLAMKHHPDRNPGSKDSEEEFRRVNAAYETLSDPQKRRLYDQFGEAGVSGAGGGPFGAGGFGQTADMSDVFEDFVESIFGASGTGGGGRRGSRRGRDLKYEASVSLEQAFGGTQMPLSFERLEVCGTCGGTGAKEGSGLKRCAQCRGSGRVQMSQGFFSLSQTCPACRGEGQIIEKPCHACRGAGRSRKEAKFTVKIPPGIYDGANLRIAGEGEAGGRGTASGDLYVLIRVKPDPRFERVEDDLISERGVNIAEAAMGASLDLAAIDGERIKIKVPAGVQHGAMLRVRGQGMPKLHGKGRGDLLVRVKVEVPKSLTPHQEKILAELARSLRGEADSPASANGSARHDSEAAKDDGGIFRKIFGKD
ncbi:MAG TPA: molecular chaperone DnaJ [Elusimicrobiota bacterium]|nr:molecular chaperone DnaJ [Elusimicrobiota bacterium]